MAARSLAAFCASLAAAAAAPPHARSSPPPTVPERYRSMDWRGGENRRAAPARSARAGEFPAPLYFTQRLDHFDGSNTHRWQQAYYKNDGAWKPGSHAPVFLCVGGEGPPLDGSAVVDSAHCNVAAEWLEETGALMFAIEHRYYGCHNVDACPVPDLTETSSLRWLSSKQALGDIAEFVRFARKEYGLTDKNKWVTWGGSYPGMLAGWARLKFPHLIFASVASSAPVRAELEMKGYFDVVGDAYAVEHERVGGSRACRAAIKKGHKDIKELFQSEEGRQRLAQLFEGEAAWYADRRYQLSFAGFGVAAFPAQSNDPASKAPMSNIGLICRAMTDDSLGDEVERLAHVRRVQRGGAEEEAVAAAEVAPHAVRGTQPAPGYENGNWLWPWQTCTEFAFYQTCAEGSNCIFTQGLAVLEEEMAFCQDKFGIPAEVVADNVEATNYYYGSDRPSGSRILYVNGEVDPWWANSIKEQECPLLPVLFVPGASHHFWTHHSESTDQDSVVQARRKIRWQVHKWLSETPAEAPLI